MLALCACSTVVGVLLISLAVCVAIAIIGGVLVAIVLRKLKQSRSDLDTVLARYTDDFEEARTRAHSRATDIDDAVKDMRSVLSECDAEMQRGAPSPASETTTISLGGERRVSGSAGRLGRGRGGSGYGRVGGLGERDAE